MLHVPSFILIMIAFLVFIAALVLPAWVGLQLMRFRLNQSSVPEPHMRTFAIVANSGSQHYFLSYVLGCLICGPLYYFLWQWLVVPYLT